ncbi:MAG: ATP-binding cassette domain-containing protein [Propionibacteriaceae bacterium]|nr:ATP-binding cassette domain-containing protein [Propionibacteriaceae bacterium]
MFMCDGLTFGYRDLLFESCCATVTHPRVGITGRNGSGKTTLLRLLDGQLKPQSGEVVVEGATYLVDFDFERYARFAARDIVALCEPLKSFDATKTDELAERLQFSDYLEAYSWV